ncbi:hypothetical protein N9A69_01435 [Gammaproteobacteria bacterium]|nr:hypothetical protein [Gammaproteobacteria bacterium]MDA7844229.1 hypothetical protein [Gammaproteobacteria bacterium]MDA9101854.1 hypothetical protein [Gammaproteobacteria bacterium]
MDKSALKFFLIFINISFFFGCSGGGTGNNNAQPLPNKPPIAYSGSDASVASQYVFNLEGEGVDNDGTIVSYLWTQISGPTVSIANINSFDTSFIAPKVSQSQELIFELMVTDNDGATGTDEINISVVPSSEILLYKSGLGGRLGNKGRWYNYIQSERPCESGIGFPISSISPASCFNWLSDEAWTDDDWISSTGPWWIDPNHHQGTELNGFGYINVLGFAQVPGALTAPINMQKSRVDFTARLSNDFSTIYANSSLGYTKSQIYLWFQTAARELDNCSPNPQIGENCTRQSDYIMTINPIDDLLNEDQENVSFSILGENSNDWTCLGAGTNVKYECENFQTAIQKVDTIGFIAGPVSTCPTDTQTGKCNLNIDPKDFYNIGTFEFKSFLIASEFVRSNILDEVVFSQVSEQEPAEGWKAIKYGKSALFKPGSGIHAYVGNTSGYIRLGLTSNNQNYMFSDIGFQIYLSEGAMLVVEMGDSGQFNKILSVSRYKPNDTVGLYMSDDKMLILRNDEIVYSTDLPCNSCSLYPFISTLGEENTFKVYRY